MPLEIEMTEVKLFAKNNNTKFINFFFSSKRVSTYHLKIAKPAPLVRLEQNRLCKLGVKVAPKTPKKSFHSSKCLFRVSHTNNFYVILTC